MNPLGFITLIEQKSNNGFKYETTYWGETLSSPNYQNRAYTYALFEDDLIVLTETYINRQSPAIGGTEWELVVNGNDDDYSNGVAQDWVSSWEEARKKHGIDYYDDSVWNGIVACQLPEWR